MRWTIDAMRDSDWDDIRAIYSEEIATGNATFETAVPEWEKWSGARLRKSKARATAPG
jgi:phosphinothricin acetyltransferase